MSERSGVASEAEAQINSAFAWATMGSACGETTRAMSKGQCVLCPAEFGRRDGDVATALAGERSR
jgi:hypothetical protein